MRAQDLATIHEQFKEHIARNRAASAAALASSSAVKAPLPSAAAASGTPAATPDAVVVETKDKQPEQQQQQAVLDIEAVATGETWLGQQALQHAWFKLPFPALTASDIATPKSVEGDAPSAVSSSASGLVTITSSSSNLALATPVRAPSINTSVSSNFLTPPDSTASTPASVAPSASTLSPAVQAALALAAQAEAENYGATYSLNDDADAELVEDGDVDVRE